MPVNDLLRKGADMEFSLVLLSKLISMMLMAVVGYVLVKKNVLRQSDSRVISVLLVYVLQPFTLDSDHPILL